MNTSQRILIIDVLRGLVMVLMALDHVRDFFHREAMIQDPMDLETTTIPLYFTRWITHYCAPVFVFLSGLSAYLSSLRKSKAELGLFLVKRGIFLILMEITVITFGWTFNPFFSVMVLQVIWAIGISMVFLGLCIRLPGRLLLLISLVIICGHNLLDGYNTIDKGIKGFIWDSMHRGGFAYYPVFGNHGFVIIYPALPWIGIMMLGFSLGRWFESTYAFHTRKRNLILSGVFMILMFIVLRSFNGYGESRHWQEQESFILSLLSFLDVSKYPPSLLFTCMTIGPALLFLALAEKIKSKSFNFLMIFGRVPFFYYILHIYLIHILCVVLFYASGYGSEHIVSQNSFFNFRPTDFGYGLGAVYLIWVLLISLLYFFCRKYDVYKQKKKHWIYRYF